MNMRHQFRNLTVWQNSIRLVTDVYKVTKEFPSDERFGLVTQIQRSAVSIPSNIAEGTGRGTDKDFSNFLNMALGSSYELETQLLIGNNLKYLKDDELTKVLDPLHEIQKMLASLITNLKSKAS